IAVVMVAAACGGKGGSVTTTSGGAIKEGGTLRLGTSSGIDSLNPYVAFQQDAYSTFEYIYPVMVEYDAALDIVPSFAKSWETSGDGLTWTFHTVPNARWSDGQPLTAEDLAWDITTDLKYAKGP